MLRFVAVLLLLASAGFAQSLDEGARESATGSSAQGSPQSLPDKGAVLNWSLLEEGVSGEKVVDVLSRSGYAVEPEVLQSVAEDFTIYTGTYAPGEVGFLVVPSEKGVEATAYLPSILPSNPFTGSPVLSAGFAPDDLRDRILEGMERSIKAVCRLGAQPQSITGKASAAGILEIEATWLGDDICSVAE